MAEPTDNTPEVVDTRQTDELALLRRQVEEMQQALNASNAQLQQLTATPVEETPPIAPVDFVPRVQLDAANAEVLDRAQVDAITHVAHQVAQQTFAPIIEQANQQITHLSNELGRTNAALQETARDSFSAQVVGAVSNAFSIYGSSEFKEWISRQPLLHQMFVNADNANNAVEVINILREFEKFKQRIEAQRKSVSTQQVPATHNVSERPLPTGTPVPDYQGFQQIATDYSKGRITKEDFDKARQHFLGSLSARPN